MKCRVQQGGGVCHMEVEFNGNLKAPQMNTYYTQINTNNLRM